MLAQLNPPVAAGDETVVWPTIAGERPLSGTGRYDRLWPFSDVRNVCFHSPMHRSRHSAALQTHARCKSVTQVSGRNELLRMSRNELLRMSRRTIMLCGSSPRASVALRMAVAPKRIRSMAGAPADVSAIASAAAVLHVARCPRPRREPGKTVTKRSRVAQKRKRSRIENDATP